MVYLLSRGIIENLRLMFCVGFGGTSAPDRIHYELVFQETAEELDSRIISTSLHLGGVFSVLGHHWEFTSDVFARGPKGRRCPTEIQYRLFRVRKRGESHWIWICKGTVTRFRDSIYMGISSVKTRTNQGLRTWFRDSKYMGISSKARIRTDWHWIWICKG